LYRETHNAYEIMYREGKNRAVHSLPAAFRKLSEESEDPATASGRSATFTNYTAEPLACMLGAKIT
jgi:hypothetical protein